MLLVEKGEGIGFICFGVIDKTLWIGRIAGKQIMYPSLLKLLRTIAIKVGCVEIQCSIENRRISELVTRFGFVAKEIGLWKDNTYGGNCS